MGLQALQNAADNVVHRDAEMFVNSFAGADAPSFSSMPMKMPSLRK